MSEEPMTPQTPLPSPARWVYLSLSAQASCLVLALVAMQLVAARVVLPRLLSAALILNAVACIGYALVVWAIDRAYARRLSQVCPLDRGDGGSLRAALMGSLRLWIVTGILAWIVIYAGRPSAVLLLGVSFGLGAAWLALRLRRRRPGIQSVQADPRIHRLQDFATLAGQVGVWIRPAGPESLPVGVPALCNGAAREILLNREMIDRFPPDHLLAVFAHELAHAARRDWLVTAAARVARLAAAWLAPVAAAAVLPMHGGPGLTALVHLPALALLAWLVLLAGRVGLNALSRFQERRANRWALQATADPQAFVAAMTAVHAGRTSAGEPGLLNRLLVQTHPTLQEVVAQANEFSRTLQHDAARRPAE